MTDRSPPPPHTGAWLGVARTGRIVDRVLARLRDAALPGVTTGRLDQLARAALANAGASPSMLGYTDPSSERPFPAAIAVAINDRITGSGDPDARLAPGDLVTLDLVAHRNGWHADAAVSFVVPGGGDDPDLAASRRALAAAASAVTRAGIEALRPNRPWAEAVTAMARAAQDLGVAVLRGFDGHAIGPAMHAPPRLPNHPADLAGPDEPGGPVIRTGMILAIEPVVARLDPGFVRDAWEDRTADGSDACFAEATVIVGRSRNLVVCGGS
jgi:methionyl aminopeptidase